MNAKYASLVSEEELEALQLAERFGLEIAFDVIDRPLVVGHSRKVSYAFAKHKSLLPIEEREDGSLVVAFSKPADLEAIEEVRCLTGQVIEEVFCPKSQLERAIERCYHRQGSEMLADLEEGEETAGGADDEEYDLLEQASNSPVIRMLNAILAEAIQQGASDIHFEPLEKGLIVRY
ncbi:MAG TPA: hypothetical protein PLO43_04935, partial [Chlamydiales bacterium]|nr:hypothetical protein [Chlamydiales bacterium]